MRPESGRGGGEGEAPSGGRSPMWTGGARRWTSVGAVWAVGWVSFLKESQLGMARETRREELLLTLGSELRGRRRRRLMKGELELNKGILAFKTFCSESDSVAIPVI